MRSLVVPGVIIARSLTQMDRASLESNLMQQKHKTSLALIAVIVLSVLITLYLPVDDHFKGIASTPAILALIGALWQILRDQVASEKDLRLQQKEHIFGLGVTSHMANAVFDKHISFCEEYMAEVHSTVDTLIREGPTTKVSEHTLMFFRIRQKYSAWITDDISRSLEGFEGALSDLADKARRVDLAADGSQQLARAYDDAEKTWNSLLGPLFKRKAQTDARIDIESIRAELRKTLGIEKLMKIRRWIIDQAARCIDDQ
jgi:hypothetical protein